MLLAIGGDAAGRQLNDCGMCVQILQRTYIGDFQQEVYEKRRFITADNRLHTFYVLQGMSDAEACREVEAMCYGPGF